jgi:hypothetical protein
VLAKPPLTLVALPRMPLAVLIPPPLTLGGRVADGVSFPCHQAAEGSLGKPMTDPDHQVVRPTAGLEKGLRAKALRESQAVSGSPLF